MTKQAAKNTPPPPPGFVLDEAPNANDVPAPPPGFEMVQDANEAEEAPGAMQTWAQGLADVVTFGNDSIPGALRRQRDNLK